ncbi:unnamed protein product [Heterobilharzia americana]|nr:unnamed protein product [Heterobilharzia americana]
MIPPVQYSYPLAMSEAKRICGKRWDNYYSELKKENPHLPQQKFESFVSFKKLICFKASYLLSAFHKGLHFPTNYQQLHPALEINNIELQWSLGALLYKLTASTSEEEYNRKVAIILIVVAIILLISAVLGFVLYSVLRKRCSRIPKQSNSEIDNSDTYNVESHDQSFNLNDSKVNSNNTIAPLNDMTSPGN